VDSATAATAAAPTPIIVPSHNVGSQTSNVMLAHVARNSASNLSSDDVVNSGPDRNGTGFPSGVIVRLAPHDIARAQVVHGGYDGNGNASGRQYVSVRSLDSDFLSTAHVSPSPTLPKTISFSDSNGGRLSVVAAPSHGDDGEDGIVRVSAVAISPFPHRAEESSDIPAAVAAAATGTATATPATATAMATSSGESLMQM
jgi:hypothetical protein